MTIEEKVYELLSAALPAYGSPATELVAASRIKPPGDWQGLVRPYLVHFPVAVNPLHTHDGGLLSFKQWPFYQVSVFADTYSSAREVAQAVVATLTANADPAFFWRNQKVMEYEADVMVQQIVLDFEVWEAL